jgi:hypothetical protein
LTGRDNEGFILKREEFLNENPKGKNLFNYSYTGKAPDAYFYMGTSGSPNEERGIRIQYPPGSNKTLGMKRG